MSKHFQATLINLAISLALALTFFSARISLATRQETRWAKATQAAKLGASREVLLSAIAYSSWPGSRRNNSRSTRLNCSARVVLSSSQRLTWVSSSRSRRNWLIVRCCGRAWELLLNTLFSRHFIFFWNFFFKFQVFYLIFRMERIFLLVRKNYRTI